MRKFKFDPTWNQSFRRDLCLDIWLGATNVLLELQEFSSKRDIWLEEILSILSVAALVASVLLDVQTNCGT